LIYGEHLLTSYFSAAIILFLVLLFRFIADLPNNHGNSAAKGKEFVDILIVAVTVIVVAIPGKKSALNILFSKTNTCFLFRGPAFGCHTGFGICYHAHGQGE
jgi:hypothetical protein